MRIARTLLRGYARHKNHPEARVRERYRREARVLPIRYAAALRAMQSYYSSSALLTEKVRAIRTDLAGEFGLRSTLAGARAARLSSN